MLQIESLSVELGGVTVLSGVHLRARRGELIGVIGPNGSGKSTLLRALSGLVAPANGLMMWDGSPLPDSPRERARLLALSPQTPPRGEPLRLEEWTMLGRTPHLDAWGRARREDREAVEEAIALCAHDLRGRFLDTLSGGQLQRAALCRALATRAPMLLLDEPVSALDLRFQHEVLDLIARLTRERALVTLCVLHGLNLAAQVCDSLLLLRGDGTPVAFDAPERVMTRQHLESVYAVPLNLTQHPLSGRPQAHSLWPHGIRSEDR